MNSAGTVRRARASLRQPGRRAPPRFRVTAPENPNHRCAHLDVKWRRLDGANEKGDTVPVAIEMNFKGATLEQYDKIVELMGLTSGDIPPGAIFHWTAKTDDGIRVVDVWESREVFDRFSQEQIGPFSQQVGITEPPEMTYRDVHNHLPHS